MFELAASPPRILIVEDELIVSADIAARLKRMGYQVASQVDSAEAAIEFCARSRPDLVLMDIRLKGSIDGITAADTVRQRYQIPIVFLTAHADEPTLQRAKVTEPSGYVLKPFEERELRIVIETSLYRDQSQKQIHRLEEELKQSQRMEALGQLAVGIAHDLNNILTVICVNHSLLVEKIPEESVERELLTGISQATDRASRMTQQLLAIGKNQMVQPKILELNSVIRESMPLLEKLLTPGTHCDYQPCNRSLPILADQNQIEQILLNLLMNARNAMPQGGTITLRTSFMENCEELVALKNSATLSPTSSTTPAVLLEVQDTGCGIDPETQKRIWEPFFSSKENGIGLGLAVVYGAVQQVGGCVSLDSTVGKGSVFRVYLPMAKTE